MVIVDTRSRILHLSARAFEAHGQSPEGWIGRSLQEVLPADPLPTLQAQFQAALNGAPQSFSYRTAATRRVYVVQLVPVPDAASGPTCATSTPCGRR